MAEPLTFELPESLQPLTELLQTIAESWLAYGAASVAIWGDGQLYANWAEHMHDITESKPTDGQVFAPIKVGETIVARLYVFGPNSLVKKERLRLDADIIASKLQNQHLLNEIGGLNRRVAQLQGAAGERAEEPVASEATLQKTQHQFDIFRNLVQLNLQGVSFADYLSLIREVLFGLISAESVFTWADSLEAPQQLDAYPRPLASSGEILKHLQAQPVQDEIINHDPQVLGLPASVQNLVVFPLINTEDIRARIGIVNQLHGDFTHEDVETVRMFAQFLQQQSHQIFESQKRGKNEHLRLEMEEAFEVQNRLFPQEPLSMQSVDLYGYSRAAKHVGGDFYDYFVRYDGQLAFSVGDVSGKGVPSALMMSLTRALLKNKSNRGDLGTPQAVMAETVGDVYEDFMRVKMFATAFVGFLNPFTMELVYANAGHSPVIYCPLHGDARMLDSGSPPLGILEATYPFDEVIQLNPGDCLIVATDGLSEAHHVSGEQFGDGRLIELVARYGAENSAEELARLIFNEIDAFSEGAGQSDDQTLLILKIE